MAGLTIEVDYELFARARQLAETRELTVTEMLKRLLRVATAPPLDRSELPPLTRHALGMAPPLTDEQVAQILDEERMQKYGTG